MALVLKDRVREQASTTGTGTFTLSGSAYDGYRTFASCVPDGSVVYYCIHNTATGFENEWEVGYGTFTLSGDTLSRTSIMASSNSGSAVDFSAGTKEVFITYPAEKAIYEETNGETLIDGGPITVVGQGVTVVPALPAELGKFVGNVDLFAQIYNMNQSDGSSASADFVAYNDLTTDGYTNFIDMGINSSTYTSVDYPIFTPGSGYLFHDGDKLFIGTATSGKDVVVFAGGVDTANVALTVSGTDLSVTLVDDLNVGGDLDVTGATTFGSTVTLNADPTTALEAATKQYVDNATSNGFHVHTPVLVATTGNLTATYNNGTSGVGATLTNSGAQAALSVDGVSMSVNDRVLVWQQTTGTQNGVYTVTTVGDGSTNWVLTRATDADTAGEGNPNSLGGGDYFFVSSGATLGFFSFVCTNTDTITFGTTAITFTEFSQVPAYSATAPLNLSGNTLSLTGTVAATNGGTGTSTVTTGDLLYGSGTNTWGKLAAGAGYKPLVMNAGGTAPEWNALALNQSGTVSGALPETHGGTNQSTYTLGDTLYSSAANTLSKLSGNTTTTKMYMAQTGNGSVSAAPVWAQVAAADISGLAASATTDTTNAANISSGTLPSGRLSGSYTGITGVGTLTAGTWTASTVGVAYGGTGKTSYTTGDIVYASASGTLASLADVATGNALISGGVGVAPSYGKIGLTTHISGTLAVANGGTGATTLTGYVYGNGTGAMTASTSIPNSATTATSANTASAIVARDASGNFSAGTITATLSGNASTATSATDATNAANVTLTTSATASAFKVPFANTTVSTTGNYGLLQDSAAEFTYNPSTNTLTVGTVSGNLSGNATTSSSTTGNAATATTLQTARLINGVSFDGSANINVNTNNAVTFNALGAGGAAGSTFNGSGALTVSYNTVGAPSVSGANATGTWGISVSGNAATATTLQTARTINETSFNGSANVTIPRVKSIDDRAVAPSAGSAGYATFGFGSWANNNTSPYADYWLMRSYTDATGGSDNLVSFRKDTLGMRVWQQSYGSATDFSSYKDVAWTDGTNATGTWTISTSGSAATLTTGRTIAMTGDVSYTSGSFNGSANVTGTATLANSGVTANTYGSASAVPVLTVDAKGRITSATTAAVSGGQYFGTAAVKAIAYNSATIAENVTVTAGNNGLSAGPVTINTGFAVTVQTGANWVVV